MELIEKGSSYVLNTYNRFKLVLDSGEGSYLYDQQGKKYLDFVAGIAVNNIGYHNTKYLSDVEFQLKKLIHCSNLYWNEPMIELAEKLVLDSGLDKVFFCNSGAEANEAALKLARKYGMQTKGAEAYEVVSMKQSFHGRTTGALSLTGQEKYQSGFNPLLQGIQFAELNNFDSVVSMVNQKTCAIIIEPIQGEGGIIPCEKEFLSKIRALCNEKDILLIFDEIQCGIGRTGKFFAYQNYEIMPDIVTLAKGVAGGIPMGGMLVSEKYAGVFTPGTHASTFGGNPLACAAGLSIYSIVANSEFLEAVMEKGIYMRQQLETLKRQFSTIFEVRGLGLMLGIEFSIPVGPIVASSMESGLLLIGAGEKVIRLVPALTISTDEIDEGIRILVQVLETIAEPAAQ